MSYYNNLGNKSVAGVQIMERQTVHSCTRVAHNITILSRDVIRIHDSNCQAGSNMITACFHQLVLATSLIHEPSRVPQTEYRSLERGSTNHPGEGFMGINIQVRSTAQSRA
jgi:hypothetical protein